jgi:hypothetical protein
MFKHTRSWLTPTPQPKTCSTCVFGPTLTREGCICPKMRYGYDPENADSDGVTIFQDKGWGMIPGPDFGCIHHGEA